MKLICIGEKFVPQTACLLSEVNKYTAKLSFGSLGTLYREGFNRDLHKVVYKKEKLSAEIDEDIPSRLA